MASAISAKTAVSAARSVENAKASTARRPGAHVVCRRSNSRRPSNSRISSAVRDIYFGSKRFKPVAPAFSRAGGCIYNAGLKARATSKSRLSTIVSTLMRLCQSRSKELRGMRGRRRLMHERIVQFAPAGGVPALDFAHTLQNRLPEIAQHDEWAMLHRFLVQHFPDDGEFYQRPRASLARYVAVAESHQFKKPILPCCHRYFLTDPAIGARLEKT